jgi:hypothetical protein
MENKEVRTGQGEQRLPVAEEKITEGFEWILDENLLRDEGVMYGLTDGDAQEKLKTIEAFYHQKANALNIQAEQTEKRIRKVEDELLITINDISDEQKQLKAMEEERDSRKTGFLRQSISLLCYAAAVFLTFWLMYSWLRPKLEYPVLIAVGIYLFGSLNLFTPGSFLFAAEAAHREANPRERWKLLLEELVVPLIATLFVILWGYNGQDILPSAALGFLLYALFLFAGKGLLTTIDKWVAAKQQLQHKIADQRLRKKRIAGKKKRIQQLREEQAERMDALARLQEHSDQLQVKAQDLQETAETRKAYFMSEFALARSARNQLSGEQLMHLSANKKF